MEINVYNEASSIYRAEDKDIYNGFGLKHNQIIDELLPANELPIGGMVLISQTIGEAINLLAENLTEICRGGAPLGEDSCGDLRWDDSKYSFFLELKVGSDWRRAGAINPKVGSFRATMEGHDITVCAYDAEGKAIASSMEFSRQFSKYIPIVAVIIAADTIIDPSGKALMDELINAPTKESLARVYNRFSTKYRREIFNLNYDIINAGTFKDANSIKDSVALEPLYEDDEQKQYEIYSFPAEAFKSEYQELIPSFGPEYIFPESLYSLSNAIACGDIRSILFHGPAGTGKTMACKLIAELINMPIMDTVNCTENLDEFVLGKYVPEGNSIIFKESYVTKAIRDGGAVVFEEINFAKPQYLAFLNSLLDDNGFVRLDNGEVIKRHENFRFFATMNIGYFGTKELNQALYNRFQTIVEISELSDKAIRTMLIERVPDCAGFVDDAIKLYHQIKDKIRREELDVVISPRNLENWMRMCKYESVEEAADKTIVPIAKGDRDLEVDLKLLIKQCKWR